MPFEWFYAHSISDAVQGLIPNLEDTQSAAHKYIYFNGWKGLAASAVLRAITEHPPPSLRKKFSKIIHIDCSSWKSRRALQRAIAEEVKLPRDVMAVFDRQDEEDDLSGIDEGSRAEIEDIGRVIFGSLLSYRCLVVFHNGSNDTIDLTDFGIPQPGFTGNKILWTFTGRLRLNKKIRKNVDTSHLHIEAYARNSDTYNTLLKEESREITSHSNKLGLDVAPGITKECCLYLLSLNRRGGNIMNYNWAAHASNYWVCDGIVQGSHENQAWEAAGALHQEMRLEGYYSSNTLPDFSYLLDTPRKRWILVTNPDTKDEATPESTSLFLAFESGYDRPLLVPNDMFNHADKLRVLKLCHCTFSFSSPPFHGCRSLRFLGLHSCKDQQQEQEGEPKKHSPPLEIFQRLWVLDVCNTDWELDFPPEAKEQMSTNIREVHINNGRIWRSNLAWRRLQNLRKLRVIEPTLPWETDKMDEFTDMVKLDHLELSRNVTIQVLPSLSGATSLKTVVLDGCVGLKLVGPQGLPPSLESFSLDAGNKEEAQITCISLAGCVKLVNFSLLGSLPYLKELNLSHTAVKRLGLIQVPNLNRIILLGCLQLLAILWPEEGMRSLKVLCIDTRGGEEVRGTSPDSLVCEEREGYGIARVAVVDMRFLQSLVIRSEGKFCWNTRGRFNVNLCLSSSRDDGQSYNKDKMSPYISGQLVCSLLHGSSIPRTSSTYEDVNIEQITVNHDNSSVMHFQPLDIHVEIGEGISNSNVVSEQAIRAFVLLMDKVQSLHMHDNSSITSVIPEDMTSIQDQIIYWSGLKWCRVERCHKLDTVFATNYKYRCFEQLETFRASDLLMARCIWSRGRTNQTGDNWSFAKLRTIHLHSCLRLMFVLPLSWAAGYSHLPCLETLHIVCCSELTQVFPVEPDALTRIYPKPPKDVLLFPNLKHIYLHDLFKLQQICESKMYAPKLETIRVRGCWGLTRLPATAGRRRQGDSRPVVDCEKDWWEKLEWDGMEADHHPSLFEPRHSTSTYYNKALPRGSVLR